MWPKPQQGAIDLARREHSIYHMFCIIMRVIL
jgi:hypothetical protein